MNAQDNVDVSPSPDTILNSPGLANVVRLGNQSEIQVSCQCKALNYRSGLVIQQQCSYIPQCVVDDVTMCGLNIILCSTFSCESQTNTPCSSSEQFFNSNAYVAGGRSVFLFFPSIFRVPFISELESSLPSPSLIK